MTKDLMTTAEAASLYGCTPRHIQTMVQRGQLVPADRVAVTINGPGGSRRVGEAMLFRPRDVLRCRAERAKAKRAHVEPTRDPKVRERVRARMQRLLKVYYSLPREVRAKAGRQWMQAAQRHLNTARANG